MGTLVQLNMFTQEEQTGTGQLNLLNAIDHQADRIKTLRRTPHTFHADAGHGWLEVNIADLSVLGISHAITACSYRCGEKAYLEEDYDASIYMNALFPNRNTDPEWNIFRSQIREVNDGDCSRIRSLRRYK